HPAKLIKVIIATTAYTHNDRKRSQPAVLPTFPPCSGNFDSVCNFDEQILLSISLKPRKN
ncbi:hypothetical protein JCM6882_005136, partial [Rhodosporidiobolus microsporus]